MANIQSTFVSPHLSSQELRRPPTAAANQPAAIRALLRLAKEPEDARITGGTRSLDRRLLGLNKTGSRTTATAA